jgi:hypothetical protein
VLPGAVDKHQLTAIVQRRWAGFDDLATEQ